MVSIRIAGCTFTLDIMICLLSISIYNRPSLDHASLFAVSRDRGFSTLTYLNLGVLYHVEKDKSGDQSGGKKSFY